MNDVPGERILLSTSIASSRAGKGVLCHDFLPGTSPFRSVPQSRSFREGGCGGPASRAAATLREVLGFLLVSSRTSLISSAVSSRHCPGARSPSRTGPTATRTRRRVGKPTAAVMRRTCRLRPSRIVSRSHAVGTFLRNRIGTGRSGRGGSVSRSSTSAGRVGPSREHHSARAGSRRASAPGTRSTWTR